MPNKAQVHFVTTNDNHKVALWQITNEESDLKKSDLENCVFLTHGTFSDKRICLGVASFLAERGFTCFILEWRNHGDSDKTSQDFNFETIAKQDIKASFEYLRNVLEVKQWHCITHSGGGICLMLLLIHEPNFKQYIKSITMVACQAFGAVNNPLGYARILIAKQLTKLIGFIPAKALKLSVVNETYATMQPWFDWNLSKQFGNRDKSINYQQAMQDIDLPIYAISGAGDSSIAPTQACYQFWQSFNKTNNQFKEFGLANGNLENYSHSRIILSKNASQEVWQSVLQWIQCHD